ncbi:MAG: UDP-2,4-diacetamido-2,4,6-trideoxy-beta-L-altropyranose hydrolase, partial [Acidobacteria bacterium RIFCSPLOWO2_12_FULL_67_14b]
AAAWPEGCDILVVDHYGLDSAFEEAARGWAKGVVVIDDLADRRHACDLLVDTAPDRTEADYAAWVPAGCRLLLGPRYALVRPRFAALRRSALARRATAHPVRRMLVSLGGTDPADVTSRALEGIARSGVKAEVDVVLGRVTPHLDRVRAAARRVPRATRVLSEVSDMAALMAKADLAVGAGGTTTWERCCLGLPTVLVTTARNQEHQAAALAARGAALHLGWHEEVTAEKVAAAVARLADDGAERRRLALAAAELCDGEGASRFVAAVSEVLTA